MKETDTQDLFEGFLKILGALGREKVEYILIGDFAVILYGFARLTTDIDLFVKPDEENLKRLKRALKAVFPDDPEIDAIDLKDLNEYSVIRFGTTFGFCVDIIAAIGKIFSYADLQFEVRDIEGVAVRVATPETLFRMKKDTVRPEDKRDAWFLSELIAKSTEKKK